jgi:thiol-disulfide isomerase/thioredoxin
LRPEAILMEGKRRWFALAGVVASVAVVIVLIQAIVKPPAPTPAGGLPAASSAPATTISQGQGQAVPNSASGPVAPELVGIVQWLNSEPLTLADLRGKVVLVDFWTYTCINCLRTFPYLRDWHEKYASKGLIIVGIHSPEFEFEKIEVNVRQAVARERVTWPVAMDNDFATWRAYRNRFWPHKFLVDKDGVVRYDHIGEGAYLETELAIRQLLTEAGADVSQILVGLPGSAASSGGSGATTRELYAGLAWAWGNYLGNLGVATPGTAATFMDTFDHEDGRIYLHGTWEVNNEYARHARTTREFEDYVVIKYTARSVNIVVRPLGTEPFNVVATLAGVPIPATARGEDIKVDDSGRTYFQVDSPRLYNVVRSAQIGSGELKIAANSSDFLLYTYTFGS